LSAEVPNRTNGETLTRSSALARTRSRLEAAEIPVPESEAEWLLLHALGIRREALWASPQAQLHPEEEAALAGLVRRRVGREPLQLLLGEVPFHGVTLAVRPGVFIPRPETELLVEAVLDRVDRRTGTLLDWGTGTGAIAIALLAELPGWTGVAADRSPEALALTAENAARNGVERRLALVRADFGAAGSRSPSGGPFDLVVSNPPYIRSADLPSLMPEVRSHDPAEALDGGPDGLDAFRHLALGLPVWLKPRGLLALEIGADQADQVLGLCSELLGDARVLPDRAGLPRIVIGSRRGG
jgi:release factor glutamine methyltransferase